MGSRWKPCHSAEGPRWRTWVLFRDGRPAATLVCDMRDPRDDTRVVVYPLDDTGTASRFAGSPASGVVDQLRDLYGVDLPEELRGEDAATAARRLMPSLWWAHGASCREAWADITPDHPEPGWGTLHVSRRDGHRWPWRVTWKFGGLLGGMGYMSTLEEAVDFTNREAVAYLARASNADTEYMRWRRRAAFAVIGATSGNGIDIGAGGDGTAVPGRGRAARTTQGGSSGDGTPNVPNRRPGHTPATEVGS